MTDGLSQAYMFVTYMPKAMDVTSSVFDRELKKGSAELLILSLLEVRARHGYEISQLIEQRSEGTLKFNVASFYPLLYRLEKRGWIEGRWVEKAGQRRRRYYMLTGSGKRCSRRSGEPGRSLSKRCKGSREWGRGRSAQGISHPSKPVRVGFPA